jgi:predicted metal-dependent peptidase
MTQKYTKEEWQAHSRIMQALESLERDTASTWRGIRFSRLGVPVFTTAIPTAAVGMRRDKRISFFFNLQWVVEKGFTSDELKYIISHELWHIQFDHFNRLGKRDPQKFNVAGDAVINEHLERDPMFVNNPNIRKEVLDPTLLSTVKLKEPVDFKDAYTEKVYDLMEDPDGSGFGKGFDVHQLPDELKKALGTDGVEALEKLGDLLKEVSEANTKDPSKGCGKEVFESKEYEKSDPNYTPPCNQWEEILAKFFKSNFIDDFDEGWDRPEVSLWSVYPDIILPSERDREKEARLIYLYADISGSMTELIPKMARVIQDFVKKYGDVNSESLLMTNVKRNKIMPFVFNTSVYPWDRDAFEKGKLLQGGGGTSFEAVVSHVEEVKPTPDMVLVLTDGQAGVPQINNPDKWCWYVVNSGDYGYGVGVGTPGVGLVVDGGKM